MLVVVPFSPHAQLEGVMTAGMMPSAWASSTGWLSERSAAEDGRPSQYISNLGSFFTMHCAHAYHTLYRLLMPVQSV